VTHDQEEAMVMSDRIALLRMGELEQVATPREIYSHPATAYTAQFIGHTNLLRAEVHGGAVRCNSLSWETQLPDGPALLSLRPENIRPAGLGATPTSSVRFRGRLRHQAFHGATELLQIECADGVIFIVRTGARADWQGELEFEFDPADAVPVRDSAERA
jgi:ABC-type Fe3+/spermidine/putrescine transport system ATPase subunit